MGQRPVLIRADASVTIGTGHVMRNIVLARALAREDIPAVWLCRPLPVSVEELLRGEGFPVIRLDAAPGEPEADAVVAAAAEFDARAVVFDHYGIDAATEARVRAAGFPVLAVDDMYAAHDCDLLLNQNLYADRNAYRGLVPEECRILGGWRYALLRDEFVGLPQRPGNRPDPAGFHVLVSLGGADRDNVTLRALRALERVPEFISLATLIVGGSNEHRDALAAAAAASPLDVAVVTNVRDMARRMSQADLAITGGGTTHLELVAAALPALMLTLADNQERVTAHMGRHGLAVDLGWHEDVDEEAIAAALADLVSHPARYEEMQRRLAALGPAGGAHRVARALLGLELRGFDLVPMQADDLMDAFHLSNEPSVRVRAFGQDAIPLERHRSWFRTRITDTESFFYAVRDRDNAFVGQIRLDRERPGERRWVVSYALAPAARGYGLGRLVIQRAIRAALGGSGPHRIDALVKTDNPASLRSFMDAGFVDEGVETVRGAAAHRLVFRGE